MTATVKIKMNCRKQLLVAVLNGTHSPCHDFVIPAFCQNFVAGVKNLKPPPKYENVEFPPERRKLKFLEKQPLFLPHQRATKMPRQLSDMRGPEPVHNKLIHKQYGIKALQGGALKHGHLEMMRYTVNRKMNEKDTFAVWRVDAPWKSMTKKGQGHRMGSGKGSIDHYTTPVKAGRIIIEMGGYKQFDEVFYLLRLIAEKLPFKAIPVSQQMLEEEEEKEKYTEENNLNIFSFQYALENNFLGFKKYASPYDYRFHGKYR